MRQQIKLEEYTEGYAEPARLTPVEDMEVFFKTKDGRCFEGHFFRGQKDLYKDHFDNMRGQDFEPEEIESWHPVKVDM